MKKRYALEHLFRIDANLELVAIEEGCIIILIILVFESPSRLLCLRRWQRPRPRGVQTENMWTWSWDRTQNQGPSLGCLSLLFSYPPHWAWSSTADWIQGRAKQSINIASLMSLLNHDNITSKMHLHCKKKYMVKCPHGGLSVDRTQNGFLRCPFIWGEKNVALYHMLSVLEN